MKNLLKLLFPLLLVSATLTACGEGDKKGENEPCQKAEECQDTLTCDATAKKCVKKTTAGTGKAALGKACTKDDGCDSGFCFDTQVPAHGKICAKKCGTPADCQGAASGLPGNGAGFACSSAPKTSVGNVSSKICEHHTSPSPSPSVTTCTKTGNECGSDMTCVTIAAMGGQMICAKECTDADAATVCTPANGGTHCKDGATKASDNSAVKVCSPHA